MALLHVLVSLVAAIVIFASIPRSGSLGTISGWAKYGWIEELISHQDFVLPKTAEDLISHRINLIENKDLFYDYHYRVDQWKSNPNIDSRIMPSYLRGQKKGGY